MELGRKIKSGARTMIEQAIIEGTNKAGFLPSYKVEHIINRTLLNDVLKSWGYQDEYKQAMSIQGWTYTKPAQYIKRKNETPSFRKIDYSTDSNIPVSERVRRALLAGHEISIDDVPLGRQYVIQIVSRMRKTGVKIKTNYCNSDNRTMYSYQLESLVADS